MNIKSKEFVYRVQDMDGRGPWKPGFSHRWVEDRPEHEFAALMPGPLEFAAVIRSVILRSRGANIGYGCRSLKQLRRWFTAGEHATLIQFGYQVVRMKVDRILAESEIQCVFERAEPLRKNVEAIELYPARAAT